MELRDKVCIVTGGASGIGAAACQAFSDEGAKVVAADLNGPGAEKTAAQCGGLGVGCDVGVEADVQSLVARTRDHFGPIDVFFSNAGISSGGDPLAAAKREWQHHWDVNLMASVHAIDAVLPEMLERGSGYLLYTASMAGILTSHGNVHYAVSKHALVGLAEWMSIHYHDRGVRSSLLAPLGVRTPMLGPVDSAFASNVAGPIREPEEVAAMVVDAIREERFLILTDPIAQDWTEKKIADPERWLRGMRRMWAKMQRES